MYNKKPFSQFTPGFSDLDLYFVTKEVQSAQFYRDIGQLCYQLNAVQGEVPGKRLLDNPPFCLPEASFSYFCKIHQWSTSKWQLLYGKELRQGIPSTISPEDMVQKLLVPQIFHGDDAANFCALAPYLVRTAPKRTQKINRTAIKIAYSDPLHLASECGRPLLLPGMQHRIEEVSSRDYNGEQEPDFYVDLFFFWISAWREIMGISKLSCEPVKGGSAPSILSNFCQKHSPLMGGIRSVLHAALPYDDVGVVFFIVDPHEETELRESLCALAEHFFCSFEPHFYAKFITEEQFTGYRTAWPWELEVIRKTCSLVSGDTSVLDRLPAPQIPDLERQGRRDFFPFYFTSPLTGFVYLENSKKLALMRYYQYLLFGCCLGKYLLLNKSTPLSSSHMIALFQEKNPDLARMIEQMYHLYLNISESSLPAFEQTWNTLFLPVQQLFQEFQIV